MTKTLLIILLAFSKAFSIFDSVDESNDGDTNMENGASGVVYSALKEITTEVTYFKAVSLGKESWITKCSHLTPENDSFACNISMPQATFQFAFKPIFGHSYSATVNISGLLLQATFDYNNATVNLVRVDECTSDLVVAPVILPLRKADAFIKALKDGLNNCIPMCQQSFY